MLFGLNEQNHLLHLLEKIVRFESRQKLLLLLLSFFSLIGIQRNINRSLEHFFNHSSNWRTRKSYQLSLSLSLSLFPYFSYSLRLFQFLPFSLPLSLSLYVSCFSFTLSGSFNFFLSLSLCFPLVISLSLLISLIPYLSF